MTKTIFSFLLALAAPAALAQQPTTSAAPAAQQPIVLKPGNMQVQAHSAANRPDRVPVYPGGELALGMFFLEHVNPEVARAKQTSGMVLVRATVNADGSVTDPVVSKSLSPECDAEALRVVPLMTGWQPAMRRGRPLAMLIELPVPFGGAGEIKVEQNRPQPKRRR
jgi:protein TonB